MLPAEYADGPFSPKIIHKFPQIQGISEPRRSSAPSPSSRAPALPNARLLSNLLFREPPRPHPSQMPATSLVAHWAALVHLDLVHIGSAQLRVENGGAKRVFGKKRNTNLDGPNPLPCCAMENSFGPPGAGRPGHPECFPILVSSDDPKFRGLV